MVSSIRESDMMTAMNVVLKFLWYLFSRLVIWGAAAGLVLLAFFMAMDYMNASTLMKDGMQARAETIIKGSDPTLLAKVFSKGFIEKDEMLKSTAYEQYKVSSFDYSADSEFKLAFPWDSSVTFRVTEEVSNIVAQASPTADTELSETPPDWKNAVYDVQVVRYEDSWRIVAMKLVEVLPSPTPSAESSPSPSISAELSPSVSETIAQ